MKHVISFLFLQVVAAANAYSGANAFKLNFKDGSELVVYLDDEPVLKINDLELLIESGDVRHSYQLTYLKDYRFIFDESGIADLTAKNADYTRDGDFIIIGKDGQMVDYTIVSMSGIIMSTGKGGNSVVDISGYPKGIYLLTVNGSTSKIEKR